VENESSAGSPATEANGRVQNESKQRSSDQTGHVGEVAVPQRRDEVVHQPELGRLAVDVGRDEEEARLGTQHGVGGQQVLAGAPLRTQHGGAGGQGGQEDEEEEEEERADRRGGDDVHGGSALLLLQRQREKATADISSCRSQQLGVRLPPGTGNYI